MIGAFFKKTWLPALLFAGPILALEVLGKVHPFGLWTLCAIVVVPPIWWTMTMRQTPSSFALGAGAGALCGAGIASLLGFIIVITNLVSREPVQSFGGLVIGSAFIVLALYGAVLAVLGAAVGVLTALFERVSSGSR